MRHFKLNCDSSIITMCSRPLAFLCYQPSSKNFISNSPQPYIASNHPACVMADTLAGSSHESPYWSVSSHNKAVPLPLRTHCLQVSLPQSPNRNSFRRISALYALLLTKSAHCLARISFVGRRCSPRLFEHVRVSLRLILRITTLTSEAQFSTS